MIYFLQWEAAHAYIGEDDANIADKIVQQNSPLLLLGPLYIQLNAALHQGVLTHEHHTVLAQTPHQHPRCCHKPTGKENVDPVLCSAQVRLQRRLLTRRMSWNCLDPTLSAATMNARSYLSRKEHSLLSYCTSHTTSTQCTGLHTASTRRTSYVLLL